MGFFVLHPCTHRFLSHWTSQDTLCFVNIKSRTVIFGGLSLQSGFNEFNAFFVYFLSHLFSSIPTIHYQHGHVCLFFQSNPFRNCWRVRLMMSIRLMRFMLEVICVESIRMMSVDTPAFSIKRAVRLSKTASIRSTPCS